MASVKLILNVIKSYTNNNIRQQMQCYSQNKPARLVLTTPHTAVYGRMLNERSAAMRGKRRESCAPLRSNLMKIAILSLSKGRPPEALATIPSEYARRHFNYLSEGSQSIAKA